MWFFNNVCFILWLSLLDSSESVTLTQSPMVIVSPGSSVTLDCVASGYNINDHHMCWFREGKQKRLVYIVGFRTGYTPDVTNEFKGRVTPSTSGSTAKLKIDSLTAEDNSMYYCARNYYGRFDYWGQGTTLTVTSVSPSAPSLFPLFLPPEDLPSNGLITIGCLAKDIVPPVISFTWDNQNASIDPDSIKQFPSAFNPNGTFTYSSQMAISVNDWWNFQPFYCMANNTAGTGVAQVIRPTFCFKPEMIIRAPRLEDFENPDRNATIVCMALNLHTAHATVQWLKNGHVLSSGFATTGPSVMGRNGYSFVSELTVDRRDWVSDKIFSCEIHSENFTSIKNISKPLVCDLGPCSDAQVHVETIPPTFTEIYMTKSAKLTCRISNIPYDQELKELEVVWTREHDNTQLKTVIGKATAQENNELVFVDATASVCPEEWDTGETFKCKVTFPSLLPTAETRTLQKFKGSTYRAPTVYVLPPPTEQLALQETATITCLMKGFYPNDFFVKWLRNNEPVGDSEYFISHPTQESKSPERYFTHSTLNVREQDWSYGATYTCVVGHEALPLQTTQKTIDKNTGKPTLVNISLVLSDATSSCY